MKLRKSLLSGLMIATLCSNTISLATDTKKDILFNNPLNKSLTFTRGLKLAGLLAFAAALIKYACTEPHNNKIRFDVEEFKVAFSEFCRGINVKENLLKIRNFAWYFTLDGIIGHGMKKRSIRIDPDEPTKLFVHPGAKSKGLFGLIAGYHKGIFAMLFFMKALDKFEKDGVKGWNRLIDFVGLN